MTTTGSGSLSTLVARAKRALGWATADREVEAEGAIEELAAEDPAPPPADADPDEVLEEAELHVRADHGDLAPEVEPDRPAPADPPLGG